MDDTDTLFRKITSLTNGLASIASDVLPADNQWHSLQCRFVKLDDGTIMVEESILRKIPDPPVRDFTADIRCLRIAEDALFGGMRESFPKD